MLQPIYFIKVSFMLNPTTPKTLTHPNLNSMNLSIFKLPHPKNLAEVQCRSHNTFVQYYNSKKRQNVAMHKVRVQRLKLLVNLDIYQWRNHTEFPIIKIKYVEMNSEESPLSRFINSKIYVEYCPIKLSHLYDLNLGQAIYLLKQSIIGFQRLYTRFGHFAINAAMISINQKGLCKVWINQNPAINQVIPTHTTEQHMVQTIIKLLETHSNESKGSRRVFSSLKECKSFFQSLIKIEKLIKMFRILVPKKFIYRTDYKEYPKSTLQIINQHKNQAVPIHSFSSIRLSIRSTKAYKQNSKSKNYQNRQFSPNLIKRFKSENKIGQNSFLKASQGETSHSRNIKSSNLGIFFNSPRDTGYENSQISDYSSRKKNCRKWIQKSSFMMGSEEEKPEKEIKGNKKQKKQLSQSEAFKRIDKRKMTSLQRKFSGNYHNNYLADPNKRFCDTKKSTQNISNISNQYSSEFKEVLDGEDLNSNSIVSPKRSVFSQFSEDQKIKEHAQKVIQTNGWNLTTDLLKSVPRAMENSFHAGEEQVQANRHQNLQKLGNLGRRQIIMSMLPEEENFL